MQFIRLWLIYWRRVAIPAYVGRRRLAIAGFAVIATTIFLTPSLRRIFIYQLPFHEGNFWNQGYSGEFMPEVVAQNPDDVGLQLIKHWYFNAPYRERPSKKDPSQELDILVRQHLTNPWLIASRLRYTLKWMRDGRKAGYWEERQWPLPKVVSEKSDFPRNVTPQQLQKAISLARRGRQIDPQNAFFDTSLVCFLLYDHRDEEAYRVLAEAAHKKFYEDYIYNDVRAEIKMYDKGYSLPVEAKLALSDGNFFDAYTALRHAASLLSWNAWKIERRGAHQTALAIRSNAVHLYYLMIKGRTSVARSSSAELNIYRLWHRNPLQKTPRPTAIPTGTIKYAQAQSRILANTFAAYAHQHNRANIALESQKIGEHIASLQPIYFDFNDNKWMIFPEKVTWSLVNTFTLSVASLVQWAGLLAFCGVLNVILLFTRSDFKFDAMRNVLICSTIFLCAIAALIYFSEAGGLLFPYQIPNVSKLEQGIVLLAFFTFLPLIISTLVAWIFAVKNSRATKELTMRNTANETGKWYTDIFSSGLSLCATTTATVSILCSIAAIAAWTTKATLWSLPFSPPSPFNSTIRDPGPVFTVIAGCGFAFLYIGWLIRWRWFAPSHLRSIWHSSLRLHRELLGAHLFISTCLYLLFLIASLPARNTAEVTYERYLQQGELAILKQK